MARNQHVVPYRGKWAVKGDGNKRVSRIVLTRRTAIEIARRIARNQGSDVVIHGSNGDAPLVESYGSDPFPPPDLVR
jgi:hypothetical protein